MRHSTFIEHFLRAQRSTLNAEQQRVLALRYGMPHGDPHPLDHIGQTLALSRERIRQIVERSLLILHCTGKRQIAKGETAEACAVLLLYLQEQIRPEMPGYGERTLGFAREELASLSLNTYALPLLVALMYGCGEKSKGILAELLQANREVLSTEEQAQLSEALRQRPVDGGLWNSSKVVAWVFAATGRHIDHRQGMTYLIRLDCSLRERKPRQPSMTKHPAVAATTGR